jgi:hypothetical protein
VAKIIRDRFHFVGGCGEVLIRDFSGFYFYFSCDLFCAVIFVSNVCVARNVPIERGPANEVARRL